MIIWFPKRLRVLSRIHVFLLGCLIASFFFIGAGQAHAGWQLLWSDDFDGSSINSTNWIFDSGNGNGGWGNHELESYTTRTQNVYVANGALHIVARKENYDGQQYTSAKLKTRGLFSQKYGRFEFYAKLPQGKGYWPALWMMPEQAVYGHWAASGEIDVMENRGSDPEKVFGTLHFGGVSPHNAQSHGPGFNFPTGDSVNNFHLYAVEWTTNAISWYVDDHLYERQTNWWSSSNPSDSKDRNPYPAPFNQPFYIIMNLAVGGMFGGNPDDKTTFPGEMQVKYVRVYGEAPSSSVAESKPESNKPVQPALMPGNTSGESPSSQQANDSRPATGLGLQ
jgi:beta-glucanase (GH16 family)